VNEEKGASAPQAPNEGGHSLQLVPIRRRPWPSISGHQWQAARAYVQERCELRVSFRSRCSIISCSNGRTHGTSAVLSAVSLLDDLGDVQLGVQRLDETGLERLERPNLEATAVQTIVQSGSNPRAPSEGIQRAFIWQSEAIGGQSDGNHIAIILQSYGNPMALRWHSDG
jgi:hypothetical protein